VDSTCVEALASALRCLDRRPAISVYGDHGYGDHGSEELADTVLLDLTRYSAEPLLMGELDEQHTVTIEDLALYIYTSGTTGLPKAAKISHARLMQWSHWFAGMMDVAPSDRMYNCLPMHHSVGGVQAPGAMLVSGASVVIREKFSASAFWEDIRRSKCTHFQYIGELCRYLLHTPPSAQDANHRVRLACGNGLAPEVWDAFKERFQIPRILEFYAATEGNLSLFNLPGRSGAIGHIPPYLAHRFSPPLVLHDPETGEPARAESGLCIKAAAGQTGEALGRMVDDPSGIGSRFDGYSSEEATEAKILRDAFAAGDQWFRTGDLMRRDEQGFFYFVDRAGDTFRRKGENVATSEVAAALCTFPGVRHANVYGVAVAGVDGRVGMATLVAEHDLDLAQLWDYLAGSLPRYARPVFLRMRSEAEVTGTWKYRKADLVREGYDLRVISDPLYVDVPAASAFIRLDTNLYDQVQAGSIRF
jgi:fatty-acyl-CoA synthase